MERIRCLRAIREVSKVSESFTFVFRGRVRGRWNEQKLSKQCPKCCTEVSGLTGSSGT